MSVQGRKRQDAMEHDTKRPRRAGIFSLLAFVAALLCGIGAVRADDGDKVRIDIEAGSASVRLNEWANLTGFSVFSNFETTGQLKTKAVSGVYSPIEALDLMIASTGLKYSFVHKKFVTLYLESEDPDANPTTVSAPRPKPAVRRAHVEPSATQLGEVTVMGTRIPHSPPVGGIAATLDQEFLESIDAATVVDAIRTLPQMFGGGPSEDTFEIGTEARTNSGRGIGANLRGLDASSTLVLINDRRLAPGGSEGVFVDITSIPLVAVKQVDIMSDGASALYGADAVGGVVNFKMLEDFTGSQTLLRAGGFGGHRVGDLQLGQLFGRQWDGGDGLMAFEYYEHDSLHASERKQATSDLRGFGGDDFRSINANPGTLLFAGSTWAIPRGQDGTDLDPADLIPNESNKQDRLAFADILPEQERWSAYANVRHTLTDNLDLFADALFTDRRAAGSSAAVSVPLPVTPVNPFFVNPLNVLAPVTVAYNFQSDFGPVVGAAEVRTSNGVVGLNTNLSASWNLTATAGYALEEQDQTLSNTVDFTALQLALMDPNPETAFNPFGDGSHTNPATLEAIRTEQSLRTHSRVSSVNVTATGPVLSLPGGLMKLAVGTDIRQQSFEAVVRSTRSAPPNEVASQRDVRAVFGELYVPLVSEENERAGLRQLDLSLAARFEDYSDFGRTTTPRIGLSWKPLRSLSLRATWAESMRAPSLYDLNEINNVVSFFPLPTPAAPGGFTPVLVQSGKNAGLTEERAESWTLGLDFTPAWRPELSLALTFFNVEFRDRIEELGIGHLDYLNDPRLAELVTLHPTPAQMQAACANGIFSGFLGLPCESLPVAAILDLRTHNGAYMRTNGLDVIGKYDLDTALGKFKFSLLGTYILDYSEAEFDTLPIEQKAGTQNYPVELRLRGATTWKYGRFASTGVVNYSDSYRDTSSTPNRRVSSWTTLDLNLAYTFGDDESDTRVSVHLENAFNDMPPFLNNQVGLGYDAENGDLTGRVLSFRIRKNW
jgi:iron complex outermembrane receptor protein